MTPPTIESETLIGLLGSLLGIGMIGRTVEKRAGVARSSIVEVEGETSTSLSSVSEDSEVNAKAYAPGDQYIN